MKLILNWYIITYDLGWTVLKLKGVCIYVVDHLVQSFIRFAGASYTWYVNVHSGTVGDR